MYPRSEDRKTFIRAGHPEACEDFVPRKLLPAPLLIDGADDSSNSDNQFEEIFPLDVKEAEPTEVESWIIEEKGTPHTRITHELIGCMSRAVMGLEIDTCYYTETHNRGVMLSGVEDPFLSMGDRVISLFNIRGTSIALWTCFWVPRVPKFRFMMLGSELAYEYNHGFPVEKQFSSVRFPMSEEDRKAVEKNQEVSGS